MFYSLFSIFLVARTRNLEKLKAAALIQTPQITEGAHLYLNYASEHESRIERKICEPADDEFFKLEKSCRLGVEKLVVN